MKKATGTDEMIDRLLTKFDSKGYAEITRSLTFILLQEKLIKDPILNIKGIVTYDCYLSPLGQTVKMFGGWIKYQEMFNENWAALDLLERSKETDIKNEINRKEFLEQMTNDYNKTKEEIAFKKKFKEEYPEKPFKYYYIPLIVGLILLFICLLVSLSK